MQSRPGRAGLVLPIMMACCLAGGSALVLLAILARTDGHVLYTLDDPYIHLALAERIAMAGYYGINPGEPAAPASSILYPALLALLLKCGLGQAGALVICAAATGASGLLFCAILAEAGAWPPLPWRAALWRAALISATVVLAGNLIGLEFTGLEHALHLALCLGCVLGALRFLRHGKVGWGWLACAVAAPLVRYEGASVWLGSVLLLGWYGRGRLAWLVAAAGLVPLAAFSLWLHARGLAWLPSSVLVKLHDATAAGGADVGLAWVEVAGLVLGGTCFLAAGARGTAWVVLAMAGCVLLATLWLPSCGVAWVAFLLRGLMTYGVAQLLLLLLAALCALPGALRRGERAVAGCALFGALILVAHLFAGRFGWLSRYEAYALVSGMAVAAIAWAAPLRGWMERAAPWRQAACAVGVVSIMLLYALRGLQAPANAAHVYQQQYQLHRFVTDFLPGPVAVNDLGLTSFNNPNVVVDLWGLGSEAARRARLAGGAPAWMDMLASHAHVRLAMIFTDWFESVPPGWVRAGTLTTGSANYINIEQKVDFYATRAAALPDIQAALRRFGPTLPPGDRLDMP